MQLRFASFAVINLRRDLHPQERAHAGRTAKKTTPEEVVLNGGPEGPSDSTLGLTEQLEHALRDRVRLAEDRVAGLLQDLSLGHFADFARVVGVLDPRTGG